ncbi:MAG TPA: response regulator [Phycisphaerae bacterium]|nr:response regulator [Phycisphaerae bacterium]
MSGAAKILIADDEQDCIDFVRESLADTPYEVLAAMDGEQALEVARRENPQLIILDVQMPKRTGFEVFAALRADEKLKSIPVIMLTAVTERTGIKFSKQDMGEYMGSEPEAYVDKPIEPIVLKQAVNRLLKQSGAGA